MLLILEMDALCKDDWFKRKPPNLWFFFFCADFLISLLFPPSGFSVSNAAAKFGFVKYRYRLHAEAAKKELNERPAFDGLCPSLEIGE